MRDLASFPQRPSNGDSEKGYFFEYTVRMTVSGADFSELIRSRRSIRDFSSQQISQQLLDTILEDAKWSPSGSNTQPYFLAIATGERKDRITAALIDHYKEALKILKGGRIRKLYAKVTGKGMPDGDFDTAFTYPMPLKKYRQDTGYGLYKVLGIKREDKAARERQWMRNYEFFGAPVVIFIFVHEDLGAYSVLDAGIFLQSVMLSAQAHGLGSCAQGALATWGSPVRAEFTIPDKYKLIVGVSLGYPTNAEVNSFSPGRRDLEITLGE
jgi:nitroreductase